MSNAHTHKELHWYIDFLWFAKWVVLIMDYLNFIFTDEDIQQYIWQSCCCMTKLVINWSFSDWKTKKYIDCQCIYGSCHKCFLTFFWRFLHWFPWTKLYIMAKDMIIEWNINNRKILIKNRLKKRHWWNLNNEIIFRSYPCYVEKNGTFSWFLIYYLTK